MPEGSFIWLVSCMFCVFVVAGGGFLLMYLILPETHHRSSWFLVAGVTLVCIPWFFWFLTCIYRVISRACGFRGGLSAGGGGVTKTVGNHEPCNGAAPSDDDATGAAMGAGDQIDGHDRQEEKVVKRSNSSSSNASHESEKPLASSIAS